MKTNLTATIAGTLCAAMAVAQQPNVDEMVRKAKAESARMKEEDALKAKWNDARAIRYHVVGEFKDQVSMGERGSGYYGVADVTDRVEVDFDWSNSTRGLVGEPKIRNFPASLSNLRNGEAKCATPALHGKWEYDLTSVEQDPVRGGLTVLLHSSTHIPAIDVPKFCTGAPKRSQERIETDESGNMITVPYPVRLVRDGATFSPDPKRLVQKELGWTYTFTPSPLR
jgi:hypothetical protein